MALKKRILKEVEYLEKESKKPGVSCRINIGSRVAICLPYDVREKMIQVSKESSVIITEYRRDGYRPYNPFTYRNPTYGYCTGVRYVYENKEEDSSGNLVFEIMQGNKVLHKKIFYFE